MTVRAPIERLAAGSHTLGKDVSHYLCRVLRLREGDTFVAFDPAAKTEADATIETADPDSARVAILAVRPAAVVAATPLVLVYALAKGDKVDAVVRDATELGATRIIVARTARSVPKGEKLDRWRRVAEQAARQSGRADPPAVEGVVEWDAALASVSCATKVCLVPGSSTTLASVLPAALAASIAVAVGPEGGLTDEEIERAAVHGFGAVSIGPFVLRTETVAAAVLGAIRVLTS
jgi:16S rRNA (uracil1498-N3)-methyltransferase